MSTVELLCENCGAPISLTSKLVSCLQGKTGRVTCKECGNGVTLDARGPELVVSSGACLLDPQSDSSPQVAEYTHQDKSSAPGGDAAAIAEPENPQLEDDSEEDTQVMSVSPASFKFQQALFAGSSAPPSATPATDAGGSQSLSPKDRGQASRKPPSTKEREPESLKPSDYELAPDTVRPPPANLSDEAPEPDFPRPHEDSLTPHSLDADDTVEDSDDEDGLVPLGRSFQSSPSQNIRDATFQSLYPNKSTTQKTPAPVRRHPTTPHPPRAGVLHRSVEGLVDFSTQQDDGVTRTASPPILSDEGDLLEGPADQMSEEGTPEKKRRSSAWILWTIAASILLAFGAGVTTQLLKKSGKGWPTGTTTHTRVDSSVPASSQGLQVVNADSIETEPQVGGADDTGGEAAMKPEPLNGELPSSSSTNKPSTTVKAPRRTSTPVRSVQQEAPEPVLSPKVDEKVEDEPIEALPPAFNQAAAASSLREVTGLAGGCRRAGDPSGKARVMVTFAASGRVTKATISGPPFAGTQTGSCIAQRFRSARVPAFTGKFVTVTKTVTIR